MGHTDRDALIAWVKKEAHDWKQQAKDDGAHERHSGMAYADYQHRHFDAIAALLEAEVWQPIATAPKDGTLIWVWVDGETMDASYVDFQGQLEGRTDVGLFKGKPYRDGWTNNHDGDYLAEEPTHWRPLPAPPVTEAP